MTKKIISDLKNGVEVIHSNSWLLNPDFWQISDSFVATIYWFGMTQYQNRDRANLVEVYIPELPPRKITKVLPEETLNRYKLPKP